MNEMETLRIDEELSKQRQTPHHHQHNYNRHSKDSGVVDIDVLKPSMASSPLMSSSLDNRLSAPECDGMKKTALSNSLCDLSDVARRGSGGSLDSGMVSISHPWSAAMWLVYGVNN